MYNLLHLSYDWACPESKHSTVPIGDHLTAFKLHKKPTMKLPSCLSFQIVSDGCPLQFLQTLLSLNQIIQESLSGKCKAAVGNSEGQLIVKGLQLASELVAVSLDPFFRG